MLRYLKEIMASFVIKNVKFNQAKTLMSMYFQSFPWPCKLKKVLLFSLQFLPFPRSSQQAPVLGTLMRQNWEENNTKKLTDQAEGGCPNLCVRREAQKQLWKGSGWARTWGF